MLAAVYYEGQSGEEWHYIPFNKEYSGWQYASGIVIPKKDSDVRMIKLYLIYSLNGNSAYFDNVSIVKEPCSSYSYDDKGNPVSAKEGGAKTSCEYESGTSILKKYTSATGVTTSFTYESGTHNLTSASTGGVTSTNTYNAAGLVTKTETRGTDGKQVSSARYNGYGQKTSVTDENNVTTQYGYTAGHRTEYVQRGTAPSQYYDYYEGGRSSMTYMEGVAAQHYRYSNGQLTALERKSRSGGSDFVWQSYRFGYDAFGNMMSVSVGSEEDTIELARYEYETGVLNGRLHKLSYGNGNSVTYSYDSYDIFDRTTEETYNSGNESISYSYIYDSSGALTSQGSSAGEEYNYEYDSLGRLVRSSEYNNGAFEQRTEQIYDAADRLTKQSWYNGGGVTSLEYTYSGTTGLLSKLSANLTGTSIPVTYSYNGLNQISGKTVNGKLRRAYAYDTFGEYTKSIPQYVNYRDMNGALIFGEKYLYDANGRIEEVCEPEAPYGTLASYGYDVQGQLTTAEVGGTSYTYTYDTAGNILTSSDGEETHEYSYGSSTWRDLLTAYDGQEISYDGCGNPVSYYDGSTFTWTQGRRLVGYANGDTDISYTYDMAGVRSSKTVNGTEYRFTTLSGLVTRQEWDGNSIDFVYDENNQPLAMKYNGTLFYYVLDLQGDVIALADQNGTLIARYTYDPWGKLLKVTPNGWLEEQNAYYLKVAEANPLRYRGYYYDSETGFYYLQSRYYDPEIGRFINADSYASTDATGLLSTNMFAYCENDPVNRNDPTGEIWAQFAIGIASQYIGDVLGNIASGKSGLDILKPTSSVGEYIASGVSSMIPGGKIISSLARSVVSTAITEGEKYIKTQSFDLESAARSFGHNLICDVLSSKTTSLIENKIDAKRPKNYSSFAHIQYLKNPSLTRQDIYELMYKANRNATRFSTASEIMIGGVFSVKLPKR